MVEATAGYEEPGEDEGADERPTPIDRLASFRILYLAIVGFLFLYIVTVDATETVLEAYFRDAVHDAVRVSPTDGPITIQIRDRVDALIRDSPWVRIGGVEVDVTVLGKDGRTPLYVGISGVAPAPQPREIDAAMREAIRLLPADFVVAVSVPHGSLLSASILASYAVMLFSGLFYQNRTVARREQRRLQAAQRARERAAERARSIERELSGVRDHLETLEPAERAQSEEIEQLEAEREQLRGQLRRLAERETQLRAGAEDRASTLQQESQALEELLEETLADVGQKESEITELQDRLKNTARKEPKASSRSREAERLAKRMRTLYKTLDFDDRAISDLVGLRDETMKLRAEEAMKRLSEDSETATVRRKVGGLPPHLSIFELGYAGKGRIYYTRRESGGYQVRAIGAKNTQNQDLEYLSRLDG